MHIILRRLAAVLLIIASVTPALAQEESLARVPEDAAIVIRLKSPSVTLERVATLADAIQEGLGAQLRTAATQRQSQPNLRGADFSRDWLMVVFAVPDSRPEIVLSLPATDTAALVNAAREPWVTAVHDSRVFGSRRDELLQKFAIVHESGFTASLNQSSRETFDSGDLSVHVNIDLLTATYDDELAAVTSRVRQGIDQLGQLPAEVTGGVEMGAIAEMYQNLFDTLMQGVEDAESATVAVGVSPEGLTIDERLRLTEGTATSGSLAGQPTSDFRLLTQLPAGQVLYLGFLGDMQRLTQWNLDWTRRLLKGDEAQLKAFDAIGETIQQIDYGAMVGAVGLGGAENGLFRATMIVEASPVEKLQELFRSYGKTLGEININNLRQVTTIESEAEPYGERRADIITVTQEFEGPQAAVQQAIIRSMFGADGMQSRVVYLDDKYVQTTGGGREAMAAALAQLENPQGNGLAQHLSAMPGEGNLVMLADVAAAIIRALRFAATRPGIPLRLDPDALNEIQTETSYVTLAISSVADGLHCHTHVPLQQMRSLFDIGMMYQTMRRQ